MMCNIALHCSVQGVRGAGSWEIGRTSHGKPDGATPVSTRRTDSEKGRCLSVPAGPCREDGEKKAVADTCNEKADASGERRGQLRGRARCA